VVCLTEHRADMPHLEHQPLQSVVALARILGQELFGFLREIEQNRIGFHHGVRAATRPFGIHDCRDLVVRAQFQVLRAELFAQKLRALAIASTTRAKMAPDLPTMIEAGVPGFTVTQWHGLLAPHGTPRTVIDRLHKEIAKVVHRPEVTSRLALDGTEGIASSPQQFAAHLRSERERWTKVARAADIRSH